MIIMDQMIWIAVFISICNSECPSQYAECPPEKAMSPCHCKERPKLLICDTTDLYNISEVTHKISNSHLLRTYEEQLDGKYFDKIKIENMNNEVKILEGNSFHDLSFRSIYIHSEGLEKIHEKAFYSSQNTLQELYISTNKYLGSSESPYNIFNLVNSMQNLSNFLVRGETSIGHIPMDSLNSSSLHSIAFNLHTSDDYSYNLLPNIKKIELRGSFNFIPSKAFVVKNHNSSQLNISFSSSQISGSSFGSDVFINTGRTLHLEFNNNKNLKYLDKSIFKPLFDKYPDSTVVMSYNPLDCNDCNIKWIIDGNYSLNQKIIGAKCANEIPVSNLIIDKLYNVRDCNQNDDNKAEFVKICTGAGFTIFSLIVIFLLLLIIKKWNKWKTRQKIMKSLIRNNKIRERNCLDLRELLGEGNFGCVYRALLNFESIDIEVAVKTVKTGCNKTAIESCFKEGILLIDFQHERVLIPIGVCFETNGDPMIILPLMTNGDLLDFLRRRDNLLTIKQLLQFAQQIAEGMAYLSSKNFVHRDLAARNCLVDEYLCLKIGDFGLSRYAKHYYRSKNKIPLPVKWMAPECIERGFYNSQTDVWSFGVLCWEILSRGLDPYPTVDNANILHFIKSNGRLPKPAYCSDDLYKLLSQCWSIKPEFRPNFPFISDFIRIKIDEIDEIDHNFITSGERSSILSYVTLPSLSSFT